MADSSQVDAFCSFTGATRDRAIFYLRAAQGNIEAAVDAYYSDIPGTSAYAETERKIREQQKEEEEEKEEPKPKPAAVTNKSSSSKVASLSDYQSSQKPQDNEDEGQSFFAGGSEHSGQMISGPPRKKKDIAKEVFEAAKQQGAIPVEEIEREEARKKEARFHGTGFRLGDTEGPSVSVPGLRISVPPEKVVRKLVFWKNGFSVDDGPLRGDQTPEDMAFLRSISKGEIPEELKKDARGGEVDIDLEDRRTEDYVKRKPKLVPFSGAGQKLGNIAPEVVQQPQATPSDPSPISSIEIDTSQPVTSVQIRLADGSRLVGKFNHSHTIGDMKQFIVNSRPEMAHKEFTLQTTFPNKLLTEMNQSLAEANLLNAVVVQRFL